MSQMGRCCRKSRKPIAARNSAELRSDPRSELIAAPDRLPAAWIDSATDDEVPHIFHEQRSLRRGENFTASTKCLFRQHRSVADSRATAADVRFVPIAEVVLAREQTVIAVA